MSTHNISFYFLHFYLLYFRILSRRDQVTPRGHFNILVSTAFDFNSTPTAQFRTIFSLFFPQQTRPPRFLSPLAFRNRILKIRTTQQIMSPVSGSRGIVTITLVLKLGFFFFLLLFFQLVLP